MGLVCAAAEIESVPVVAVTLIGTTGVLAEPRCTTNSSADGTGFCMRRSLTTNVTGTINVVPPSGVNRTLPV